MVRLVVLVLVLVGLAVFVLQNMTPLLSLTLLGFQTPALPLSVWVVGAIALGSLSTLLTAVLIRSGMGGRSPRRRSVRSRPQRPSGSPTPPWTPPAWTGHNPNEAQPVNSTPPRPNKANDDDWSAPLVDDWDEWAGASSASRVPRQDAPDTSYTRIQDTAPDDRYRADNGFNGSNIDDDFDFDESFDTVEGDRSMPEMAYPQEQEVWDDWDDDEIAVSYETVEPMQRVEGEPSPPLSESSPEPSSEPAPPARDIVEIRREPQAAARSGTLYSFTYRAEDDEESDTTASSDAEVSSSGSDTGNVETGTTVSESDPVDAEVSATSGESDIAMPTDEMASDSAASPDTVAKEGADDGERVRVIIPPYQAPDAARTSQASSDEGDEAERVRVIIPPYHADPGTDVPADEVPSDRPADRSTDIGFGEPPASEEGWDEEPEIRSADDWDSVATPSATRVEDDPDEWEDWDEWDEWAEDEATTSRNPDAPSRDRP